MKKQSLESLQKLFSEDGYYFLGHGTGNDSLDVVNSIFENGLRTKDNTLYYTTIGLSVPTPELIEKYKELCLKPPTLDDLKHQLNTWPHKESKNVIIIRLPVNYINMMGGSDDLGGERYGAFMDSVDVNGKLTNYLSPKFIVGCYNSEEQVVMLNSNFEPVLTEQTLLELNEKYKNVLEKTKERINNSKIVESSEDINYDDAFQDLDDIMNDKNIDGSSHWYH